MVRVSVSVSVSKVVGSGKFGIRVSVRLGLWLCLGLSPG